MLLLQQQQQQQQHHQRRRRRKKEAAADPHQDLRDLALIYHSGLHLKRINKVGTDHSESDLPKCKVSREDTHAGVKLLPREEQLEIPGGGKIRETSVHFAI
uniref:Uncharacterized protein n=1 Tax=Vespula pensylvanica TaxID=30213 RepID=A0A834MW80_VESPE|nr:hypothetical protein H0235_018292 [Vespula pensylvanica]